MTNDYCQITNDKSSVRHMKTPPSATGSKRRGSIRCPRKPFLPQKARKPFRKRHAAKSPASSHSMKNDYCQITNDKSSVRHMKTPPSATGSKRRGSIRCPRKPFLPQKARKPFRKRHATKSPATSHSMTNDYCQITNDKSSVRHQIATSR